MTQTTRPLRILHLTAGSDAGGLSRYIFDLSSAMHSAGHQVAVAGEKGAWHWLFEKAPFRWIDIPLKGGPLALYIASLTLDRYLKDHPVDIIHAHYRRATLVARWLQNTHHVPLLYTSHLSHVSLIWPRRLFSDFGDHVHAPSQQVRDWLIQTARFPADKITLIPHGVNPDLFPLTTAITRDDARRLLNLNPDALVAAYVGRLDDPKNESWLLDLAKASEKKLPNLRILLAGEGPHEQQLRHRIRNDNLHDRVTLLGHRDPLPIYHAAEALLLPSAREGFSLVCAEAMSTGLPVLRTQTSGTTDMIIENVTGRSVPIDHDPFITAAIDFLSDRPALTRMGSNAARHIRANFTFDRQLTQTLDLYRRLAKIT